MRIIADLHIHSKYSRAVSKQMDIDHICEWAKIKGIDLVGTGDFTHFKWLEEIKLKLKEDGSGLLVSRDKYKQRFMLTSEISCIYKQGSVGSKCRKIHLIIFAPSVATVEKINLVLSKIGNIYSDGRPILGISAYNLTKLILDVDERCMIIPAHAWTPWFSIFGSKSGFNSIEECFGDLTPKIYAVETGLSSDPEMNWRLSALDNITLISNSDAHSVQNLGREANVFEIDKDKITYDEICDVIKTKDKKRFPKTIEFYPEEGKYHFDGHANCKLCVDPFENKYPDGRCPICRRPMTIGVAWQVAKLADRKKSIQKKSFPDSIHLVPLREIIANSYDVGVQSKKVNLLYFELVEKFGSEFHILLDLDEKFLRKNFPERIAQGIINVKNNDLTIDPGYDGIYGKVHIF
jgi:uncharacterized protein (TIGR00375 family)